MEGKGRVQRRHAPSGKREADEGAEERWGRRRAVHGRYQPRALNHAPGTRYHGLISCYAAPHARLIVMAVGREHGRGGGKSKGLAI